MVNINSSRGDTIIEVLLSILVVGTVLGVSYTAANRYYKNVRQAQEYTNALKIAEGQIEQIKGYISDGNNDPITTTSPFCINGGIQTNLASNCTVDTLYSISINRTSSVSNQYTYTATVSWSNINGGANSQVGLVYKAYM